MQTLTRVETSIEEEEEEDVENEPPNRPSKKFPTGDDAGGADSEAVLRPLQELQITSSSAADASFRTDRKVLNSYKSIYRQGDPSCRKKTSR